MSPKIDRVKRFTDAQVRALSAERTRTVWSSSGLALRVSESGVKSWRCVYRMNGRQRWLTLGRFPEMTVAGAYEAHARTMRQREKGIDPADEAAAARIDEAGALTVAGLVEEYLERYARPFKKSWRDDERLLRNEVVKPLGARKANDLRRRDVVGLLDRIVARGAPVTANRVKAALSKAYNWGIGRDLVEFNPCALLPRPAPEKPKERFLSIDEVKRFLRALRHPEITISRTTRLALRMVLATGQRPGECAGAAWSEFDLEDGWWTIAPERTKSGRGHRVPVSTFARGILDEARALNPGTEFPFPSPDGEAGMRPLSMARALARNLGTMELAPFSPHDLRRTLATHVSAAGAARVVVARILNHADRAVTAVYDRHAYSAEMAAALEAWGRQLAALEADPSATPKRRPRA